MNSSSYYEFVLACSLEDADSALPQTLARRLCSHPRHMNTRPSEYFGSVSSCLSSTST